MPHADHVVPGYAHASGRTIGHHQPSAKDASGRADAKAPVHRFTVGGIYLDTIPGPEAAKLAAAAKAKHAEARAAADQANTDAVLQHAASLAEEKEKLTPAPAAPVAASASDPI